MSTRTPPTFQFVASGFALLSLNLLPGPLHAADPGLGVGAKPVPGAELMLDGTRGMLDAQGQGTQPHRT